MGEQPLPKHGACNLSSINISEYVKNPFTSKAKFDYLELAEDVPYIVKAMDDVLEQNLENHALREQKEIAENYRNIGIGIMGLADCLVKLGYKYGSEEAIGFSSNLMKFLFRESIKASVALGKVRGNYPRYKSCVWDSEIIKNAFSSEEIQELKEIDHLRNCSLLSIAPTGSIGTMLNISTGCEPFFMLSYTRKTESLNGNKESYYQVDLPIVEQYKKLTGNIKLPDYFITSQQLNWRNRVKMQGALQQYCDTAISSTVNLPKEATIDEVKQLYIEAWKQGLKGITVYRSGCKREGILTTEAVKPKEILSTKAPKRPKELPADFYLVKAKGEQFIVLVGLLNNKPYEIFTFRPNIGINVSNHQGVIIKKSKMHYSYKSENLQITELELANENIEEKAATLYASMLLRHGVDIKYIIKTTKKVNNNITSFSSAMCRILSKYIPAETTGEKCPECGGELIREGGCEHCKSCGYGRCG